MSENKELGIKRLLEKELNLKEQFDIKEHEYNKTCSNIIKLEIEVNKLKSNLEDRTKRIENKYFLKISLGLIISLLITLKLLITVSNFIWLLSTVCVYILSVSGIKIISRRLVSSNLKDKDMTEIIRELSKKNKDLNNERTRYIVLKNEKDKLHDTYMSIREMKYDEMIKAQQEEKINNSVYSRKLKK